MTPRIVSRQPWQGETFSGWRGTIAATNAGEAEAMASDHGVVADLVARGAVFEVLVVDHAPKLPVLSAEV